MTDTGLVSEDLYVVVGVLKARALTVAFLDETGASLEADLPVIAGALGAGVQMGSSTSDRSTLTFSGSAPLVVAAKAAQLRCDPRSGFWVDQNLLERGEIRGLGRPGGATYLSEQATELDLD